MDKGDPCEICGGTESNLVDGFYYCAECGTQDTNVRETLVENKVLADGTFAIAARKRIPRKLKEGVKMSAEWYKWHTLNFILAGLTQQLVRLGAAPSLKMKVLWIWTRYIKKFQKDDQKKPTRTFSKLEVSSESEAESAAGSAAAAAAAGEQEQSYRVPMHRVTRALLAAVLALALSHDRSALQPSHLLRLVLHRLLDLNRFQRLLPADVDPADVPDYRYLCASPLSRCAALPRTMARLAQRLALGPPRAPDLEAVLRDRLQELRLPPGLALLALALMDRAPVSFATRSFKTDVDRHPDYEAVVTAYVLVALKMCFGLDDDRERRLSDAVDRLNAERDHPRAYTDAPGAPGRLFSPREWLAHLQFRATALSAYYAPLAWERNLRADDYAFVEHFDDHAFEGRTGRRRADVDARAVGDRVAMDLVRGLPAGRAPHVAPLAAVRACMAARAPHAALAEVVAAHARDARTARLLREDFTRYSAEYAYRALALPGAAPGLFEGVAEAGKAVSEGPDRDYTAARSDPTVVHVRNCDNKNWFRTRRPTASHVVGAEEPEPAAEFDADDLEERREEDPETFREEAEGESVFDDDFRGLLVKEEIKIECDPESFHETKDDPEIPESHEDYFRNFDGFDEAVDSGADEADAAVDSDDERPRYDPAAFDRRETIRRIMVAAYREFKTRSLPIRFRDDRHERPRRERRVRAPCAGGRGPPDPAGAARRQATLERVQGLVDTYCHNLRHDVLHQVARQVRAFVDDAERRVEAADTASDRGDADRGDADRGDADRGDADRGDADRGDADRGDADRGDASSTDTRDVRVVGDSDSDDAAPGPAEDPLYVGDARFDESEHDARQLYVRLRAPPPAAPEPEPEPERSDDDATKLLDEKIARAWPPRKRARVKKDLIDLSKIDYLVDDPESITKFNYWFTHYTHNFKKDANYSNNVQRSFDETLPRSFRFVLRECAELLRIASPTLLYQYVMAVEDALVAAMAAPRRGRARREPRPERTSARANPMSREPRPERTSARANPMSREPRPERTSARANPMSREPRPERTPGRANPMSREPRPERIPGRVNPMSREPRPERTPGRANPMSREPRPERTPARANPMSREPRPERTPGRANSMSREPRPERTPGRVNLRPRKPQTALTPIRANPRPSEARAERTDKRGNTAKRKSQASKENVARDGPAGKRTKKQREQRVTREPTQDDEDVDDDVASAIVFC